MITNPIDDGETALLLSSLDAQTQSSMLSFLPVPDALRGNFFVLSSFEDLVLCGFEVLASGEDEIDKPHELRRLFFVCNPFTQQWIALPLAPDRSTEHQHLSIASLVCDSDGEGRVASDRFRVVRIAGWFGSLKLDLFRSESGEWRKEALALALDDFPWSGRAMPWCNGKLYLCFDGSKIAGWDPFCPDTPPMSIDAVVTAYERKPLRFPQVCASQDALHFVYLVPCRCSGDILSVWRWEEEDDGGTWSRAHAVGLNMSNHDEFRDLNVDGVLAMHPSNPDIVFLEFSSSQKPCLVYSLNLRTRELKFFADRIRSTDWKVFQPRFTYWPSPIPSYEELRDHHVYDGSCEWLVQSIESTRAPTTTTECQPIYGVGELGRRPRKHNSGTSPQPKRAVKKQIEARGWNDVELTDAVPALHVIPYIDDELLRYACDLFEEDNKKAKSSLSIGWWNPKEVAAKVALPKGGCTKGLLLCILCIIIVSVTMAL